MITVLLYNPLGRVTGSVRLDIPKVKVAARLLKSLNTPGSGITPRDAEHLDSGTMSLAKLRKLVPDREIQSAAARTLAEIEPVVATMMERAALEAIGVGDWVRAQGGPEAANSGFFGPGAFSKKPRRLGSDGSRLEE